MAILSIWYRIWSSARFKHLETQRGGDLRQPPQAIAGRRKAEVFVALCSTDFIQHVVSLDYALAVDHVRPQVAIMITKHLRLTEPVASILTCVWGCQQRFLFLDNSILPDPLQVQSSAPQTDAWGVLAYHDCPCQAVSC